MALWPLGGSHRQFVLQQCKFPQRYWRRCRRAAGLWGRGWAEISGGSYGRQAGKGGAQRPRALAGALPAVAAAEAEEELCSSLRASALEPAQRAAPPPVQTARPATHVLAPSRLAWVIAFMCRQASWSPLKHRALRESILHVWRRCTAQDREREEEHHRSGCHSEARRGDRATRNTAAACCRQKCQR